MRSAISLLSYLLSAAGAACQQPAPSTAPPVELRERAFGAENQGRFSDAAQAFLELAEKEPLRTEWVVSAGRCLGRSGRFRDAIDLLDGARKKFPGEIELSAMLARTYLLKSEVDKGTLHPELLWADAADLAEGVLKLDPDHEDSRLVLAQARYLLGDGNEAVRQAEEAGRRHPKRPGAHILIGRIALDRCRELHRQHVSGGLTGQALADLTGALDTQRKMAQQAFERAAELDPKRAHPHVMLVQLATLFGNSTLARSHMLDALVADPDVAVDHSLFDRELTWQARRDAYAGAAARYDTRADAQPRKAASLRWYAGRALYDGAQWAEALQTFVGVLTDNPLATNSHYYAAICAFHLGDHDAAETHAAAYAATGAAAFASVVRELRGETRGQIAAIVQFLADRAFQKGRIENSRDLNHVLAYVLESADAWNNRALLCRDTGRYKDALDAYTRALEIEPDSPQLLNDTAVILQHHLPTAENLQKARSMYRRAIELADKLLADGATPAALRERTERARQDARQNLAELAK